MAEETKKVLFDVSIEVKQAIKNLSQTRTQIQELRKSQKELDTTTEKGKQTYEAYGAQIRELNNVARQQQKEIDNSIKAQKAEVGSMEQLKANLSNLTAEYNRLSKEQRSSAEGMELKNQIKGISDELKGAEEPMGDFRRSVGEYQDKMLNALGINNEFIRSMFENSAAMKGASAATKNASVSAEAASESFNSMASGSQVATGGFKAMTSGAKAFGMQLLKLLANPIVAMIAVMAASLMVLIGVFRKVIDTIKGNEEQAAKLTAALAPLRAIGDLVTRVFEKLGDALIWVADKFGKLVGAMGDLIGVSDSINQKSKDYIELEKEKQSLIEDRRKADVEISETELKIAELRNKMAQKDKYTAEERIQFANEAIDLEMSIAERRKIIAERHLKTLELEGARTKNNAKFEDDLAQARIAVNNATRDALNKTKELSAQRLEAVNAIKAESKAEIDAAKATRDKRLEIARTIARAEQSLYNIQKSYRLKTLSEVISDEDKTYSQRIKAIFEFDAAQKELLESNAEFEKKNAKNKAERNLIAKQLELDLLDLRKATNDSVEQLNKSQVQKTISDYKEMLSTQVAELSKSHLEELEELSKRYASGKISTEEYLREKNELAVKFGKLEYDQSLDLLDKQLKLDFLSADQRKALEKEVADVKNKYATEAANIAIKANEDIVKSSEESAAKQAEIETQLSDLKKQLMGELIASVNSIGESYFNKQITRYDEETAKVQSSLDAQLKAAGNNEKKKAEAQKNADRELEAIDKKKRKAEYEKAVLNKIASLSNIGMLTAEGIMKAVAEFPLTGGMPFAGFVAAIGSLQAASVIAQPLPKASRGKLLRGKSHANGGIPIEAEGGEAIINKFSTAKFLPLLSAINEAGGGVPLSSGVATMSAKSSSMGTGIIRGNFHYPDGGYAARSLLQNPTMEEAIERAMSKALQDMKLYVAVEDIRREDQKYVEIENRANF